jgi:hypothetical protein
VGQGLVFESDVEYNLAFECQSMNSTYILFSRSRYFDIAAAAALDSLDVGAAAE